MDISQSTTRAFSAVSQVVTPDETPEHFAKLGLVPATQEDIDALARAYRWHPKHFFQNWTCLGRDELFLYFYDPGHGYKAYLTQSLNDDLPLGDHSHTRVRHSIGDTYRAVCNEVQQRGFPPLFETGLLGGNKVDEYIHEGEIDQDCYEIYHQYSIYHLPTRGFYAFDENATGIFEYDLTPFFSNREDLIAVLDLLTQK